jgi:hypothetical protein
VAANVKVSKDNQLNIINVKILIMKIQKPEEEEMKAFNGESYQS